MKRSKYLHIFILFIVSFIISFSCYMYYRFSTTTFEQIMFTILHGVSSTGGGIVRPTIKYCIPFAFCILIFFYFLFYDISFGKITIKIKKFQLYPFKFINNHRIILTIGFFVFSICLFLNSVHFSDYLKYSRINSTFIEENYVDPKEVGVSFKEKRNLIMIFVESLETSLFNKDEGGYWDYDVIPELSSLLKDKDSVVFYGSDKSQLLSMISGASWTTASLVANNTAVPFKLRIDGSKYHSKSFMNGTYALGDMLKDNGYYNEVISGATVEFGGVYEFYTGHGDYEVLDDKLVSDYGFSVGADDLGNWGINDNYLFQVAKERLNVISKNDQPFNLSLITIDTHFVDGFVGNYSETKFNEQYENAYATTSRLIYDFVKWVKKQPYYKDTTIMIVGDHLSMQNDFFNKRGASDRYVYSCIINPRSKTGNFKNRVYTALDTYPTILYSIGADIPGNKLGLGVNLFSSFKTLAEEYGLQYLDSRLQERSKFYNDVLMDDNYVPFK